MVGLFVGHMSIIPVPRHFIHHHIQLCLGLIKLGIGLTIGVLGDTGIVLFWSLLGYFLYNTDL